MGITGDSWKLMRDFKTKVSILGGSGLGLEVKVSVMLTVGVGIVYLSFFAYILFIPSYVVRVRVKRMCPVYPPVCGLFTPYVA